MEGPCAPGAPERAYHACPHRTLIDSRLVRPARTEDSAVAPSAPSASLLQEESGRGGRVYPPLSLSQASVQHKRAALHNRADRGVLIQVLVREPAAYSCVFDCP